MSQKPKKSHLLHGDSLEYLKGFPDECFDSVVTDPPYGLGKAPDALEMLRSWTTSGHHDVTGTGFMGKAWDAFVPQPAFWREVYRVLKPGGHVLSFAGTRTQDLMGLSLRLAGFELRDCLCWAYGCLSDDTEILIEGRWEPYHKATAGRLAMCYNVENGSFAYQPIQDLFVYPLTGSVFRVIGNETDQLVTVNHRCVIDRGDGWEFVTAEEASREPEVHVPVLQDVCDLYPAFQCVEQVPSGQEQDVLSEVLELGQCCRSNRAEGSGGTPKVDSGEVLCVRGRAIEADEPSREGEGVALLEAVQRDNARGRMGSARQQGASGVEREVKHGLPRANGRGEQPELEGRGDVLSQAWELCPNQVRPVPGRVLRDGAERRVCHGASPSGGASDREAASADRSGSSRGPRSDEQPHRQSIPVRLEQRPQAVRGEGCPAADLVRFRRVQYDGLVWCVKVPTGAFVARRSGKAFVTGNSGFPKSLDISKAIDGRLGAKREVVGQRTAGRTSGGTAFDDDNYKWPGVVNVTAPATPEAAAWDGWGTSLKPSYEPVILARKPLTGTVAENVLEHGTGGLNINACRIEATDKTPAPVGKFGRTFSLGPSGFTGERDGRSDNLGRWPANVVLDEEAGRVLDEQSGGASRFFYTAKASTKERTLPDGSKSPHPTVKPESLMEWLVKLVTPPAGRVLDPFMGSGTTGVAAIRCGFSFVGIEQDQTYYDFAVKRFNYAREALK